MRPALGVGSHSVFQNGLEFAAVVAGCLPHRCLQFQRRLRGSGLRAVSGVTLYGTHENVKLGVLVR